MASSINPSNIDGTYPVAGQDNDSQGFRDNFTNIKTNFTTAKSEIEVLQTSSVTLTAENDFTFTGIISKAIMKNNADSVNALGTVGGAAAIDVTSGIIHTATLNAISTLSFTNWPSSGKGGRVRFIVTITDVAHTLTLPAAVTLGANTIQGMSSLVITFPSTGTYIYDFSTIDGGTTVLVEDLTQSDTALGNMQISGNTISSTNTNGDITLSPNGTGTVKTDNLQLDGNTISSTDTNGDITLSPNGTGEISIAGTTAIINTAASNQTLNISPNGTGAVNVPAGYKDRAGFGTNSLASKEYVDLTVSSGTIANIPLRNGVVINISGATQANPVVITTSADHYLEDGCKVLIASVSGMTELNTNTYFAKRTSYSSTTFALYSDVGLTTTVNGSAFTAYTSGGTVTIQELIENGDTLYITGGSNANISMEPDKFRVNLNDTVTGLTSLQSDVLELSTGGTPTLRTPSASNANMTIAPDGTGIVIIGGTNPTITTPNSPGNDDLIINPDGTGSIDLRGIIVVDSAITTASSSNANIELAPDGTGTVKLSGDGTSVTVSTDTNEDLVLDPNGTGTVDFDVATATTATAGSNGDVPAQVEGYISIKVGGTAYKIPYYGT